jgi:hypothetical protein
MTIVLAITVSAKGPTFTIAAVVLALAVNAVALRRAITTIVLELAVLALFVNLLDARHLDDPN